MIEGEQPLMPISEEALDEIERQKQEAWEALFTGFMNAFKKSDEYAKDSEDDLGELSGQLEIRGKKFDALLSVSPYFTTGQGPELLVIDILTEDSENPHPAQFVGWSSWKNNTPHLLACEGPSETLLDETRIFELDILKSAASVISKATQEMEIDLVAGKTVFSLPEEIRNPKFKN